MPNGYETVTVMVAKDTKGGWRRAERCARRGLALTHKDRRDVIIERIRDTRVLNKIGFVRASLHRKTFES
jgi:hypothetical protein